MQQNGPTKPSSDLLRHQNFQLVYCDYLSVTLPEANMARENNGLPKIKVVFQPSIFQVLCYLLLLGSVSHCYFSEFSDQLIHPSTIFSPNHFRQVPGDHQRYRGTTILNKPLRWRTPVSLKFSPLMNSPKTILGT